MGTQLDAQIMFKKETTFTTAVTPDTAIEFVAEDIDWILTTVEGAGIRVSQVTDYSDRQVVVKEEGGGSFTVEAYTKGLGKLIEAVLGGTGTSTLISGSAYQQLFSPTTADYLNSYTIQKGVPLLASTTSPMTIDGCVFSGFEFSATQGGIATLKFNFMGRALSTATSLATASYPSGIIPLGFAQGTVTVGGTVTVPTTTALASGGTAAANVREFNLTYENGLDPNGFNFGGSGKRTRKPALGKRKITGSMVVEYDSNTLRDAYLNRTELAVTFGLFGPTAISGANYPGIQFTLPVIKLDGELPKVNAGDVITQSINFKVLDGRVAAKQMYVAIVTAETAI